MKRRDILRGSAVGAAAVAAGGVGGSGCATVTTNLDHDPVATHHHAQAFLASLDRQLAATDRACPVDAFVSALRPGTRTAAGEEVVARHDDLFKRVLRSLFITQQFRELPVEVQVHPEVQAKVAGHLDEIDTTMFDLSDFLASQSDEQRAALRARLRDDPDVTMRVAEALDQHAGELGLSTSRRRQLRSMMAQAAFRMKSEAPGELIDEYTAKVDRLRGVDGEQVMALRLAQQMGQRSFWKYQHAVAQTYGTSSSLAPIGSPSATAPTRGPDPAPATPARGSRVVRAGGYMLGIGVVIFGVSALLVDAAFGFVFGMTLGAILVAIGLITLIIGAIMSA